MELPRDSVLLRIFVSEEDRADHQPLYQAIVLKARESRLAGATVLRGPMGYGRSAHLRTSKILQLSDNLPLIIEIVDSPENINAFLPDLAGALPHVASKEAGPATFFFGALLIAIVLLLHFVRKVSAR